MTNTGLRRSDRRQRTSSSNVLPKPWYDVNMEKVASIEKEIEQKTLRRLRKRKPKMKVSGAGVKKLQRIILKKAGRG